MEDAGHIERDAEEGQEPSPAEMAAAVMGDESLGQFDKIRELFALGYSRQQIHKDFEFPKSTVYAVLPVEPEGKAKGQVANKDEMSGSDFPVVLKVGKDRQVVSPEGVLRHYFLQDGEAGLWMFKGMMLLRAAQLMVLNDVEIMKGQADAHAAAIKPVLDMLKVSREEMDAAAQRARESNMDIAAAAAGEAAARATYHIDQRLDRLEKQTPDIASTPDPMKGVVARMMENMINRMTGPMFGGGQVAQTPGLVDRRGQ